MRLVEPVSDVVKMHGTVKSDESDLRPSVSGQIVQLILNGLTSDLQVAALLRQRRHVQQEQVDSRLRWSQHVLRRSDELNCTRSDLGTSRWVAVCFTNGIVLELLGH